MTDLFESRDPIPICARCAGMQEQLEYAVVQLENLRGVHNRAVRLMGIYSVVCTTAVIWLAVWRLW